jgi:signal transduction histidine kinase
VTVGIIINPMAGPAMTTLRSVVGYLALMVRCAGAVYIVVQVVIWHSFYATAPWRLVAPALAVAWALTVVAYLRRRLPSPFFAYADAAFYVVLALAAQRCVPPVARDDMFSWLVIAMTGELVVSVWFSPAAASVPLALISPIAYVTGARLQPVTDARTLTGAVMLLIVVGCAHAFGRRWLGGRAAAADAALAQADQVASDQYAILSRNVERREHERLLHDTVLNTLTALARSGADDSAGVVDRCRQDVALIQEALGEPDDLAARAGHASGDLLAGVRAVVAGMRARGLNIHLEMQDGTAPALPQRVVTAISNAVREALSNSALHAGTGEAWVEVRLAPPDREQEAEVPCRLAVTVRDKGIGFDLARVDTSRLGLRRSIAERAEDCGGEASVWSLPGQGTVVSLSWPADRVPAQTGPPW